MHPVEGLSYGCKRHSCHDDDDDDDDDADADDDDVDDYNSA